MPVKQNDLEKNWEMKNPIASAQEHMKCDIWESLFQRNKFQQSNSFASDISQHQDNSRTVGSQKIYH